MVNSRCIVDRVSRHLLGLLLVTSVALAAKPCPVVYGCQCLPEADEVLLLQCAQVTGDVTLRSVQAVMQAEASMSLTLRDQVYNDTAVVLLFTETTGQYLVSLEMVNVTMNFDSLVVLDAFAHLVKLQTLRIDNATISRLTRQILAGKTELVMLDMNDDDMETVEVSAFNDLQNLEQLSLRDNKLTEFPVAVKATSKLQTLDLSGNNIVTVSDGTANQLRDSLTQLKSLYLDRLHCSCKFGKGRFVEWVQQQGIDEVMCATPEKLTYQHVKDVDQTGFCAGTAVTAMSMLVAVASTLALLH